MSVEHQAMIAGEHRLALPPGYQLGKYRLREVLGSGGFGITYLAEDSSLGRRVAIKELLPNDIATRLDGTTVVAKTQGEEASLDWARERFVDEGRALAACDHPNVVNVYEMIEANGTAYMVTKFEEGRSLERWLRDLGRAPTEAELRGVLLPLLSGLDKVHKSGFLHRDIKPENIYLTHDGRPVLLDFGSARQAVTDRSMAMTSIVTSGYAPFEQYYEDGKQGAWSDIYAMAAVVFRAIHGKRPPEATRRLKDDPCVKLAKTYGAEYSAPFLGAIDKALSVEAKLRPQSVNAWREMLGNGPAEKLARPPSPAWPEKLQPVADFVRHRPLWTAGAIAAAIVGGALVWKLAQPEPRPQPMVASQTPAPTPFAAPPPQPTPFVSPTPNPGPVATPVIAVKPVEPPPAIVPAVEPEPRPPTAPVQKLGEPKLVGKWETKGRGPAGSFTLRWEQRDDGRYIVTGDGAPDTGTVTASDGRMQQVSETTQKTTEATYTIKGTQLVMTSPSGKVTWRRTGNIATSTPKENPSEPSGEKNVAKKTSDNEASAKSKSTATRPKSNNDAPSRRPSQIERKARDVGNAIKRLRNFGF